MVKGTVKRDFSEDMIIILSTEKCNTLMVHFLMDYCAEQISSCLKVKRISSL